jgi:hypothetical protein
MSVTDIIADFATPFVLVRNNDHIKAEYRASASHRSGIKAELKISGSFL